MEAIIMGLYRVYFRDTCIGFSEIRGTLLFWGSL